MPGFDGLARQYGVRPAEDVVAHLEEQAPRLGLTPTTLANRLLERAVRAEFAEDEPHEEAAVPVSASVLRELLARLHFLMLTSAKDVPSDERSRTWASAQKVAADLVPDVDSGSGERR